MSTKSVRSWFKNANVTSGRSVTSQRHEQDILPGAVINFRLVRLPIHKMYYNVSSGLFSPPGTEQVVIFIGAGEKNAITPPPPPNSSKYCSTKYCKTQKFKKPKFRITSEPLRFTRQPHRHFKAKLLQCRVP